MLKAIMKRPGYTMSWYVDVYPMIGKERKSTVSCSYECKDAKDNKNYWETTKLSFWKIKIL